MPRVSLVMMVVSVMVVRFVEGVPEDGIVTVLEAVVPVHEFRNSIVTVLPRTSQNRVPLGRV